METEVSFFYQLLPALYQQLSDDLTGSHDLLNLIVANIDPNHVRLRLLSLFCVVWWYGCGCVWWERVGCVWWERVGVGGCGGRGWVCVCVVEEGECVFVCDGRGWGCVCV